MTFTPAAMPHETSTIVLDYYIRCILTVPQGFSMNLPGFAAVSACHWRDGRNNRDKLDRDSPF